MAEGWCGVPEDSVDRQIAEEVLVLAENLAAEGGAGDVHEVLPVSHSSSSCVYTVHRQTQNQVGIYQDFIS